MASKGQYRLFLGFLGIFLLSLTSVIITQTSSTPTITVSAAASLSYVFPDLAQQYQQKTGNTVNFNFGATGQLAQQIERGAPVDVFAAADRRSVEKLEKLGLIVGDTKAIYGRGRITLSSRHLRPQQLQDLLQPKYQKIAIANPQRAPYGLAAQQALQTLGLWQQIQPKLIYGENIQQVQQYVSTGNVDAGITALATSIRNQQHWQLIPENLHQPIELMVAVVKSSQHPRAARQFAQFLTSAEAKKIMAKSGFPRPQ